MNRTEEREVPKSVAKCESFLLDLMRSIQGSMQQDGPANSDNHRSRQLQELQKSDPDGILHRLYSALQYKNVPVECRICQNDGVEGTARAFISAPPLRITLCANRLTNKEYTEALTHEATHAYDYVNGSCDFYTCEGLAYSEVRAARNGECATSWPMFKEGCIKRNAVKATSNLFPKDAPDCVARIFEQAMADARP